MRLIKFERHYDIYMPGEVAGFPDEKATALIEANAGVPHALDEVAEVPKDENPEDSKSDDGNNASGEEISDPPADETADSKPAKSRRNKKPQGNE